MLFINPSFCVPDLSPPAALSERCTSPRNVTPLGPHSICPDRAKHTSRDNRSRIRKSAGKHTSLDEKTRNRKVACGFSLSRLHGIHEIKVGSGMLVPPTEPARRMRPYLAKNFPMQDRSDGFLSITLLDGWQRPCLCHVVFLHHSTTMPLKFYLCFLPSSALPLCHPKCCHSFRHTVHISATSFRLIPKTSMKRSSAVSHPSWRAHLLVSREHSPMMPARKS